MFRAQAGALESFSESISIGLRGCFTQISNLCGGGGQSVCQTRRSMLLPLWHMFLKQIKQWPIMGHKPKYRRFQCQHSTSSLVRSHPSPIPGRPPLPSILIGFSRKHYSSSGIAGSYIENLGPCNYITARTTTPRSVHPPSGLLLHSIHPTTVSSLHNFFFFGVSRASTTIASLAHLRSF